MREDLETPTPEMIDAGEAVNRNPPYRDRTRDVFTAMIAAAQAAPAPIEESDDG